MTFYDRLDEAISLLLEGLDEKIQAFIKRFPNMAPVEAEQLIRTIAEADPTGETPPGQPHPQGLSKSRWEYLDWLVRMVKSGKDRGQEEIRFPEDHDRVRDALILFHRNKKAAGFPGSKDIQSYKTFHDLEVVTDQLQDKELVTKRQQRKKLKEEGAELVYDDGTWRIIEITKPEAAVQYSWGSKWCTSSVHTAGGYLSQGPLHIIIKGSEKVAQMHIATDQLKDLRDHQITQPDPELGKILINNIPVRNGSEALQLMSLTKSSTQRLTDIIKDDGVAACKYAMALGKEFPEGEPAILKDANSAYLYARHILKRRWPEAEDVIKNDPDSAFEYQTHVLKHAWPDASDAIAAHIYMKTVSIGQKPEPVSGEALKMAEDAMAKDPALAVKYAITMGEPWPPGEKAIADSAQWAFEYAKNVIKGRWPPGEKKMVAEAQAGNNWVLSNYIRAVKERVPEAESFMIMHDTEIINYAKNAIKDRWLEGEKAMLSRFNPSAGEYQTRSVIDYASEIVGGRWPELEQAIKDHVEKMSSGIAKFANAYVSRLHNEFPEGWSIAEEAVRNDPDEAYNYASNKGERFLEGEKAIKSHPLIAAAYASEIIKGRWPEAEGTIANDPEAAYFYARMVVKGEWPAGESALAKTPRTSYLYATYVRKRGRWPEGEKIFAKNPDIHYSKKYWNDYPESKPAK